jgi:hypothetical protein
MISAFATSRCRNRTMRSLALLALATCLACNDHLDVFQLDSGIDDGNGQDSGPPDSGIHVAVVPADILFVVDNSGSMADEQENLALNFARFVDQTIGAADYQIGVVTTDLSSQNGERGGYQNFVFDSAYPNILTNFSGSDCQDLGIAHGCFRGPDPQKRIITSSLSREEQIATFGGNVRVGSCGSGTEKGLGAILAALGYTGPGQCNEGFLRPYANLVIVIVSDEEEADQTPIENIVNALGDYKPFEKIRVATIVGSIGGEPSQCRIGGGAECGSLCDNPPPMGSHAACTRNQDCPIAGEICVANLCENPELQYFGSCQSCSFYNTPDCCSAVAGARYVEFARAVEQRVHAVREEFPIANCQSLGTRVACLTDTICQESFGDTMARIALELVLVDL